MHETEVSQTASKITPKHIAYVNPIPMEGGLANSHSRGDEEVYLPPPSIFCWNPQKITFFFIFTVYQLL